MLGAHVSGRAEQYALLRHLRRERRGQGHAGGVLGIGLPRLGEPEVEDLDLAVGRDHDVRRLQVAMDDPLGVGRLESVGDLQRDAQGLFERESTSPETRGQILALGQLHGDEVGPAVVAHLVDAGDVGMVQGGEHLGLALEAGEPLGVLGEGGRQHLDRHLATELGVLGAVDLSHAAFTELGGDLEVRQRLADQDEGDFIPASVEQAGPVGDDLELEIGLLRSLLDEKALSIPADGVIVVAGAFDPVDSEERLWQTDLGAEGAVTDGRHHEHALGIDEEQLPAVAAPLRLSASVQRDANPLAALL